MKRTKKEQQKFNQERFNKILPDLKLNYDVSEIQGVISSSIEHMEYSQFTQKEIDYTYQEVISGAVSQV